MGVVIPTYMVPGFALLLAVAAAAVAAATGGCLVRTRDRVACPLQFDRCRANLRVMRVFVVGGRRPDMFSPNMSIVAQTIARTVRPKLSVSKFELTFVCDSFHLNREGAMKDIQKAERSA
jgi:hypothetical protein